MTYNNKTKELRISKSQVLSYSLSAYLLSVICCLLIVISFLFIPHSAHAGTIIKAPAYLGLNRGLVGCWTFDGAYTKAQDCSGNNNTGTLTGGPTKVQGKVGQALSFDGVDDYVEGSANLPLPVTVNAIFKYRVSGDHQVIFSNNSIANNGYRIKINT